MRFTQSIRCAPPKPPYAQKYRTSLSWIGCLPDGNGVQLLAMLRRDARYRHLPILMLTARSSETDITKGLETGADDYLTKPFSVAELQTRLKALLRRSGEEEHNQELALPALAHGFKQQSSLLSTNPIPLHCREFALLRCLMKHSGKVLSREQLLDQAWGDDGEIADRAVDVSVRRLRKAFEDQGYDLPISTVRGLGYRLDKIDIAEEVEK